MTGPDQLQMQLNMKLIKIKTTEAFCDPNSYGRTVTIPTDSEDIVTLSPWCFDKLRQLGEIQKRLSALEAIFEPVEPDCVVEFSDERPSTVDN